jgi:predicted transcriptional regulator
MPANEDRIVAELEGLKKLMVLDLLGKGYSQTQIALTLGVAQASISRMFPKGALSKAKGKKGQAAVE